MIVASRLARSCRFAFLAGTALALASCGGGGGGGGSGGGGDAFSLSSSSITFAANQGFATPAAQTVTVSINNGIVFIATSQTGSGFLHDFQPTGATTGRITITPNPTTTPGTFTGAITVRGCSNIVCNANTPNVAGSPKTISVSYTVTAVPALSSAPASLDFVTSSGLAPAGKTLSLSVETGGPPAWSSQIEYVSGATNWLSVTPASGTLPQGVSVNADVTSVPVGKHTASITFSAGLATKVVPVSLTVKEPTVNFASPYVATTSVGGNVIIRGYGFSGVQTGLQVSFGATPASTATFVSDTEIRASYPGLTAGSYTVTVSNSSQTLPTRARLLVIGAPVYVYKSVSRPGGTNGTAADLVYDDERKAVYLMDAANNRLESYRFDGTDWVAGSLFTGGQAGGARLALSPDGTELLKTGFSSIFRIDPATLTVTSSASALALLGTNASLGLIAFANDGLAIVNSVGSTSSASLCRYDMLTQEFTELSTDSDMLERAIVASGDGGTVILPSTGLARPIITYNAADGALTPRSTSTSASNRVSVDRAGSRTILGTVGISQTATVYDSSFAALGVLPANGGFVISPDGTKAYVYFFESGFPLSVSRIRKYDLNSPTGGGFTEIGLGATLLDSLGSPIEMTISADGGTLFLSNDQRVSIVPAP